MNAADHTRQVTFNAIREALLSGDRRIKSPIEYLGTILDNHLFRSEYQDTNDLITFIKEALMPRQIIWNITSQDERHADGTLTLGEKWEFGLLMLTNGTKFGNVILISIDPASSSKA